MTFNIPGIWNISFIVMLLLVGAAWRWGAAPERICTCGMFLFFGPIDFAYHAILSRGSFYATLDLGHFAIDLAVATVFFAVALQANRVYPLWLTALQLLTLLGHFSRQVSEAIGQLAYALLSYSPFILQVTTLAVAIFLHARRVRRYGSYPSWRSFSSRSPDLTPQG